MTAGADDGPGDALVALVTGASSGIGQATVRRLARRGALVAAVARREDRLADLAAELAAENRPVLAVPADITDAKQGRAAVTRVADEFGRLDVLVNNAGVMLLGPFDTSPDDDWRRMLDLNLNGLLHVTQEAIPHLRAAAAAGPRGVADLINVGSVAGRIARGGSAVYNATKFGVTAFTEALRQELAPDGVRVCCVEPGAVATELLTHVDPAVRDRMLAGPYRDIQPVAADHIAATIEFIVALDPAAAINEILIRPARQGFLYTERTRVHRAKTARSPRRAVVVTGSRRRRSPGARRGPPSRSRCAAAGRRRAGAAGS
jgi:NADP-dependent 3-hydroxy acid dehydrogenase YdfG